MQQLRDFECITKFALLFSGKIQWLFVKRFGFVVVVVVVVVLGERVFCVYVCGFFFVFLFLFCFFFCLFVFFGGVVDGIVDIQVTKAMARVDLLSFVMTSVLTRNQLFP